MGALVEERDKAIESHRNELGVVQGVVLSTASGTEAAVCPKSATRLQVSADFDGDSKAIGGSGAARRQGEASKHGGPTGPNRPYAQDGSSSSKAIALGERSDSSEGCLPALRSDLSQSER
jgi:hypothetical protein